MGYSNSSLINYTKLSPNKTTTNRLPIDRITIHHMAGNCSIEACGAMFAKSSQRSSSNYGIGTDGRIALYVEEKHSSWCSSSTANDKRAVTIEVANSSNTDSNWPVSDKALDATIRLCADICKRNGKTRAVYFPTLAEFNNYVQKPNEMAFTLHEFFKQKNCCGPYLKSKHPYIIEQVNKILSSGGTATAPTTPIMTTTPSLPLPYLVRVKANGLNIRSGPGTNNSIMGCITDKGIYTIVNETKVGTSSWGELKLGGWIAIEDTYVDKLRSVTENNGSTPSPVDPEETDLSTGIGIDEIVWKFFHNKGINDYAVSAIEGVLYASSGLSSNNLANLYNNKLNMSDTEYTNAVDNGSYTNFVNDGAGYGLAQWTYSSRKAGLQTLASMKNKSVGDLNLQLDYIWNELETNYKSALNELKNSTSLEDAVRTFLKGYAGVDPEKYLESRVNYAQGYFNKFSNGNISGGTENKVPYTIRVTANTLNIRKEPTTQSEVVDKITDRGVYTIVEERLKVDGYDWGKLKSGIGWIALSWIEKL